MRAMGIAIEAMHKEVWSSSCVIRREVGLYGPSSSSPALKTRRRRSKTIKRSTALVHQLAPRRQCPALFPPPVFTALSAGVPPLTPLSTLSYPVSKHQSLVVVGIDPLSDRASNSALRVAQGVGPVAPRTVVTAFISLCIAR